MANDKELKKIKKAYGERFMKMCRTHFHTILEDEDRLYEILKASFSDTSETLYEDIQACGGEASFVDYIFEKYETETKGRVTTDKTPYELLDEAGYDLVECHTEEEIQSFKKYYAKNEELCTFDGNRLDDCVVFWAVKKNVDEIKRKDFNNPERDDEYGTSVMSIQFNREGTTRVSIKNRYNHTVDNPDATLGNDLEKIAPGLSYSFERLLQERGLSLDSSKEEFSLAGYVRANDGKYYKCNSHIGNTCYCPDNTVIVNGEVQKIPDPEKHYLIDCFVIDIENKTIRMHDESRKDAFLDGLTDIQKISITKDKDTKDGRKNITIQREGQEEPIVIIVDKDDKIIGYKNHELTEVGDAFLRHSRGLEVLDTPNLETIGDQFCPTAALDELNLPKLKRMGNNCFFHAKSLKTLELPALEEIGDECFSSVEVLEKVSLPNLKKTGHQFISDAPNLKIAELPELEEVGDSCFTHLYNLEEISAPNLKNAGRLFCSRTGLASISLPELKEVGDCFCQSNHALENVDLPKLESVGDACLYECEKLKSVRMKSLEKVGYGFLSKDAKEITEFETPKISRLKWFFSNNVHVSGIMARAKKAQRLNRRNLSNLDRQTVLLPEEVNKAEEVVESPVTERNIEQLIQTEDNVI